MEKKEIRFGPTNTKVALGSIIRAICDEANAGEVVKKLITRLPGDLKPVALKLFWEAKDLQTAANECGITFLKARRHQERIVDLFKNLALVDVLKVFDDYVKPPEDEVFFAEFPDLSVRAYHILREKLKIFTVNDLAGQEISELRKPTPNNYRLEKKVELELTEFLRKRGRSFKKPK